MSPTLVADPLPIRVEEDGTYHVGQTGISLDTVILCYRMGYSPEQVVETYPAIRLRDVYHVFSYYLGHRDEIDSYLQRRSAEADSIREKLEAAGMSRNDWPEYRQRLLERKRLRDKAQ